MFAVFVVSRYLMREIWLTSRTISSLCSSVGRAVDCSGFIVIHPSVTGSIPVGEITFAISHNTMPRHYVALDLLPPVTSTSLTPIAVVCPTIPMPRPFNCSNIPSFPHRIYHLYKQPVNFNLEESSAVQSTAPIRSKSHFYLHQNKCKRISMGKTESPFQWTSCRVLVHPPKR